MKRTILLAIIFTLSTGCLQKKTPVLEPTAPATLTGNVTLTLEQLQANAASRASKIGAAVNTAQTYNANQPPGPNTDAVAAELGVAKKVNGGDAVVKAEDALDSATRAKAVAEGETKLARELYDKATKNADALQKEKADLQASAAAAVAALQATLDANKEENKRVLNGINTTHQIEIKKYKDAAEAENKSFKRKVAWGIAGLGLAFIVLGVAPAVMASFGPLGPIAGLKSLGGGVPFIIIGVLGIGLAFIVNHPWFLPGCGIVGGLSVVVYVIHLKLRDRKETVGAAIAADAARLADVAKSQTALLKKVVHAGDQVYESAVEAKDDLTKAAMDKMFGLLSSAMDKPEKDAIHVVRGTPIGGVAVVDKIKSIV